MPLIGQNPGNVRDYKKGNTNGIRVDTELLGGLPAARNKFRELTGQNLPIKVEGRIEVPLPKGGRVVYREEGRSLHPKIEITTINSKGIILEKITFR